MRNKTLIGSLVTCILITLSVSMFSNIPTSSAAFGSSPPWVKNDHMLPGTTFEQIVYLSRNDTEKAMQAIIRITGDEELVKWMEITDEDSLIIEKGQYNLPMKVIVDVPADATLKQYTGGIFVTLSNIKTDTTLEGGEVGIGLGAHISVDITVIGDSITDDEINSVVVEAQEEDDEIKSVPVDEQGQDNSSSEVAPVTISDSVFIKDPQVIEMKNEADTTLFTTMTDHWSNSYYLIFAMLALVLVLVLYIRHP